MSNIKDSLVKLAYSKGNIVIQCNYNHKVFRYNAFKVPEKFFDKRTKSLKPCDGLFDFEYETNRIKDLVKSVNEAIVHILKTNDTITKKLVDEYLLSQTENKFVKVKENDLIDDFDEWIVQYKEKKNKEDKARGNNRSLHPSAKDYISCKNLLKDFKYDNFGGKPLYLSHIDDDFLDELRDYAFEARPQIHNDYTYLTEGELSNKTLQKRFDCLFTFMKHFYGRKVPENLKKPKLDFIISEIVRLDLSEISLLINTNIQEEHYKKIKDYFLFLCHTGLRFQDFKSIDKTYYSSSTNILRIQAQKTFADCEIYLVDIAKIIGEKYNFEFKDYTNQAFNRMLKDMLEKYDLFSEPHTKTYYQNGRKTKTAPKREFISSHTGRKTFISFLFENDFDTFAVMGMTGHKKVETLKHYADKFGKSKIEKMKNINIQLNTTYYGK